MTSKTLLVTGGAGFIGSNFIHYIFRKHPEWIVINLDKLTYAGNLANLADIKSKCAHGQLSEDRYFFVHGDICDQNLVESLLTGTYFKSKWVAYDPDKFIPDTIVHFAAESHVDRSITEPDAFIQTNIVGTHVLLRAAKKVWVDNNSSKCCKPRFHHVSTDEVYGSLGLSDPPFTEKYPYQPNSPYAASKASSDYLVRAYYHTYGLNVTTSNCSNNYGPYQFPEKLIPLMIINALEGRPLPIYGDGKNIRDWLYVDDHCHGLELVLEKGEVGQTYNIGGNNEQTNIDIVRLLCGLIDKEFATSENLKKRFPNSPAARGGVTEDLITFVKDRPGHDRRYAINATKAMEELGYFPEESFETGIRKTLKWYLEHESWWRGVMDGSYRKWLKMQYGVI